MNIKTGTTGSLGKQSSIPLGSRNVSKIYSNEEILMNILQNVVPARYRDWIYGKLRDHELEFDFYDLNFLTDDEKFVLMCYAKEPSKSRFDLKKLVPVTVEFIYSELEEEIKLVEAGRS